MSLPIRAVLFDAAGTLIELSEPVGEIYARLGRQAGVDLPAWRLEDAFLRVFGSAPPMVFPNSTAAEIPGLERAWWREVVRSTFLAADSTLRFADFDSFFASTWDHFSHASAWRPRAGALATLTELKRSGLATGVVSNFDHRLHKLLQDIALAHLFDIIVTPMDVGCQKPAPGIFHFALEHLGVAPGEVVYVGDDPANDLAGARQAGLLALDVAAEGQLETLPARVATLATLGPSAG